MDVAACPQKKKNVDFVTNRGPVRIGNSRKGLQRRSRERALGVCPSCTLLRTETVAAVITRKGFESDRSYLLYYLVLVFLNDAIDTARKMHKGVACSDAGRIGSYLWKFTSVLIVVAPEAVVLIHYELEHCLLEAMGDLHIPSDLRTRPF